MSMQCLFGVYSVSIPSHCTLVAGDVTPSSLLLISPLHYRSGLHWLASLAHFVEGGSVTL
jgi:hypothetical protein